ncbi:hypothetical protein O0L34_g9886 [Tuta absoluta]|nr:hypothetical protein O0L34_g9886 [Tuta absoluta]
MELPEFVSVVQQDKTNLESSEIVSNVQDKSNPELWEIVSNVQDVTDPACMERIEIYQEQLQMEDEDFMAEITEKVKNETITWYQPWYQKTGGLTRRLDIDEDNGTETYLTDSFTKEECKVIARNWKKFRKTFNVPDKPQCFARWKNKKKSRNPNSDVERARHYVTAFLAQGLYRNLYQVYKQFVTQYAAPNKGPYSKTEEKIMEICFYHKSSKAVPILSTILGRQPRGINQRFTLISKGKPEKKKVRWKLPLATQFIQSLMKHSELSFEQLKDAHFDTSVWRRVQDDIDQDYRYLQKFWYTYLHVQLFVQQDVKLQYTRKKLLKRLKSSYKVWTDIRWKEVLKNYPEGFTHGFLYRLVHPLVINYRNNSKNYRTAPLTEVMEFALNKLKKVKEKYGEKRLRTLKLDPSGNLEVAKYDKDTYNEINGDTAY